MNWDPDDLGGVDPRDWQKGKFYLSVYLVVSLAIVAGVIIIGISFFAGLPHQPGQRSPSYLPQAIPADAGKETR